MSPSADSAAAQPPARMAPSPDPEPTAPASGGAPAVPRRGYAGASWARFNQGVLPTLLAGVVTGLMLFFFNEASDRITRLEQRIDARFVRLEQRIDARFVRLEENQQEMAETLATVVALLEARDEGRR